MINANPFGITTDMVKEILSASSEWPNKQAKFKFPNKFLSEGFSRVMEFYSGKIFSKRLGCKVISTGHDNDPDLFFPKLNMPLEIKVTNGQIWRSGEFSQRHSYHLMVSRDENFIKFFVALVDFSKHKNLWESSMERGKKYYAPFFKKDSVYKLQRENDIIIFLGDVIVTKRGAIKLVKEKI